MRATRALDKKSFKQHLPESLVQIQNNFTELVLMMPSTKIAQFYQRARLKWKTTFFIIVLKSSY